MDKNHYKHAELMIKCFLAIIIQICIVYLRFKEAIESPAALVPGTPALNIIRLTSAFFMHIQLYPEIKVSIDMIKYSIYHQEKFKGGASLPILLASAKAFGAIMAELGSSYLIVRSQNVQQCLVAFLGMSIVANIDNIMANTITGVNLQEEINKEPIMYKRGKKSIYGDIDEVKEWLEDKNITIFRFVASFIMIVVNRLLTLTYIVCYFYFCPFLVILMLDYLKQKQPEILP